jgi:hypothetical protein
MSFSLYLAFIFLMFKIAFADIDPSLGYDHLDASLFSVFQEPQPDEDLLLNFGDVSETSGLREEDHMSGFENVFANSGLLEDESLFPVEDDSAYLGLSDTSGWNEDESLFALGVDFANPNLPDNNEWNGDWLSSCREDTTWQPSKLRARNAVCPADPSSPVTIPEFPDIEPLGIADEPTRPKRPYATIEVDGVRITANEPEYYCHRHSAIRGMLIPVCSLNTRAPSDAPFNDLATVYPATLRKFQSHVSSLSQHSEPGSVNDRRDSHSYVQLSFMVPWVILELPHFPILLLRGMVPRIGRSGQSFLYYIYIYIYI